MIEEQEDNLLTLMWRYLLKKKVLIFSITLIAMICGFIYTYLAPHSYTAYTTILPPMEKSGGGGLSSIMSSVSGGLPLGGLLGGGAGSTEYYLDILNSNRLSKAVCNDLNLYDDPIFENADSTVIESIVQSSIETDLEMSGIILLESRIFTNFFPEEEDKDYAKLLSSKIANSYISNLNKFLIKRENDKAYQTRNYIENELSRYNSRLDSLALILEEFQIDNKLLAIDEQTQATISQASGIAAEVAVAKTKLDLARLTFAENSQEIIQLKNQVRALEEQYSNTQSGGISDNDQFSIPLSNVPNLARRYSILYRDRKVLEQVILFLETQKHQEAIQEMKDVSQIDVLDYASVPLKRTSPSRLVIVVATGLITAILIIAILMIQAYRKGKSLSFKS